MFGNNGSQMEQLVKKHQWNTVNKKLQGASVQTKLAVAAACGGSSDEGALICLIDLLRDGDETVQLQAIKSLGSVGSENAKTHLQALSEHLPVEKDALKEAIRESIANINKKNNY